MIALLLWASVVTLSLLLVFVLIVTGMTIWVHASRDSDGFR